MYLSARNVLVKYGRFTALDNVSFGIESGDIFGLIGPNGSGKTTMLKVIIGLIKPQGGSIALEDRQINPSKKEIRRIIGYCPQENSFFDRLTVKENIRYFASLYDVKGNSDGLAESLAKHVNINDKLDVQARRLSGGMKRRLNIACSIVHGPRILLLDEPTIELDPFSRMTVWRLIERINRNGTTVIVSSNSMEEVSFLCKNVVFLWQGTVHYTGAPKEIIKMIDEHLWSE